MSNSDIDEEIYQKKWVNQQKYPFFYHQLLNLKTDFGMDPKKLQDDPLIKEAYENILQ